MILIEGIMHRRIKWWIAGISILLITAFAAIAITVQAASWQFGGEVVKYVPACVAVRGGPACPGAHIPCPCLRCGCIWGECTLPLPEPPVWSEIILQPMGKSRSFSCPVIGFKYSGVAPPSPKKKILGYGSDAYKPFKIGLGRQR